MAEPLLERFLSRPQARRVSRALKTAGYKRVTYHFCYDKISNIAFALEPHSVEAKTRVAELIMVAAGLKPPAPPEQAAGLDIPFAEPLRKE